MKMFKGKVYKCFKCNFPTDVSGYRLKINSPFSIRYYNRNDVILTDCGWHEIGKIFIPCNSLYLIPLIL